MKIRSGFVSNSSSSSFLLVGMKKDELTPEQLTMANNGGLEEHGGDFDEPCFIGEEWYISEYETKSFHWDDVQDAYDRIRNVLGDEVDIKVYVGMRYS